MHSDRIPITVGKDETEKTFLIPRDFLARSGLFPQDMELKASSDGSVEPISLPDESPIVFSYFFYYIYYFDVRFPDIPEFKPDDTDVQTQREQYVSELCQTWVFGDKYSIPGLQNCAMYKLCEILGARYSEGGNCLTLDCMRYCYENTEPGAKLRHIVADHVIRIENRGHATEEDLLSILSVYRGFARDVLEAQQEWDSIKNEVVYRECFRPKYLKAYKYAARYEVEVEVTDAARIPATSRAVWSASLLKVRCRSCGSDGTEAVPSEYDRDYDRSYGRDYDRGYVRDYGGGYSRDYGSPYRRENRRDTCDACRGEY